MKKGLHLLGELSNSSIEDLIKDKRNSN